MYDEKAILEWYTGKGKEHMENVVFPLLREAQVQECWPKGASRKVWASLSKANVAQRLSKSLDRPDYSSAEHDAAFFLSFPQRCKIGRMAELRARSGKLKNKYDNMGAISRDQKKAEQTGFWDKAERFAAAFEPLVEYLRTLDQTRPRPTFEMVPGALSPTAHKTLETSVAHPLNAETRRMPDIEWVKEEYIDTKGLKAWQWVGKILWPEGTVHGGSRFSVCNSQCEVCGHGIRRSDNWVPILVDDATGKPHSLFIGRDCAARIFGYKGDAMNLKK